MADFIVFILTMMVVPFIFAAAVCAAFAIYAVIMAPFYLFTVLCLYKFNVREMMRIEWGIR